MTAEPTQECAEGEHQWRAFTEDEVKDLRTKARTGRPPMAWVENGDQCGRCGRVEATVSWYGQVQRVPFAPKTPGGPAVVQWPTRSSAPGGGGGMGMR